MNINPALVWIIIGVLLVIAEVATSTFTLLFFAIGCAAAAIAAFLGLTSVSLQITLASLVSGLSLLMYRKKLVAALESKDSTNSNDLNDEVFPSTSDIPPKASAKVIFRGTSWTAINNSESLIRSGDNVRIIRTDGVKLIVEKSL